MTWGELKAILDRRLPDGDETKIDYIDVDLPERAEDIQIEVFAGKVGIYTEFLLEE